MKKVDFSKVKHSSTLGSWFIKNNCNLVFLDQYSHQLFVLGIDQEKQLQLHQQNFSNSTKLSLYKNSLWISSEKELHHFENKLLPNQNFYGYDKVFTFQQKYTYPNINIHQLSINEMGCPIILDKKQSKVFCLDTEQGFVPLWELPNTLQKDYFLIGINTHGDIKYASLTHKRRVTKQSLLFNMTTNEAICYKLSQPSPSSIYQDKIWLFEANTGYFGYIEQESKTFVPFIFCNEKIQSINFIHHYAILGFSENQTGFLILNLQSQIIEEKVFFEQEISDISGICIIPSTKQILIDKSINFIEQ
ncbi:MAG: DUF4915 domain-containing protein [Cytophagales bacterium]|nr:DUF4915 domain-containing protein [Cytophagales bacterium]